MPDRTERDRLKASPDAAGQPPAPDTRAMEPARRKGERAKGERAASLGEALHDALTGAHSRASLHDRLRQEVERARRYALPLSLLVVDLDHFKSINDAFGHRQGDTVLKEITDVIKNNARKTDVVARYGGEEFVVLLPQTDKDGAFIQAERMRTAVKSYKHSGQDRCIKVTISLGVSTFPSPEITKADDLVGLADNALYKAKNNGRDKTVAA